MASGAAAGVGSGVAVGSAVGCAFCMVVLELFFSFTSSTKVDWPILAAYTSFTPSGVMTIRSA
ncbi:hypothetical protein CPZ25_005510 [Eubacterium maltosivorans]|uniref:Uncharacterized protein n=1 Tax=Eubacterium maltosivorans TaxID=2041044 RepID=A0A4V1GLS5_EUBML|nr:hypothetical protein CPZ25_005510 [Eubacterium maltosivorans]